MLVDYGFISPEDLKLFRYFSTPEEGFTYLKKRLEKLIDDINDMIDDD